MQHLTSFHITVAGRHRLAVGDVSPSTTLADVVERLCDQSAGAAVVVDGRITATSQPLIGCGIRHGSRVDLDIAAGEIRPLRSAGTVGLEAVWVAGPDAGGAVAISPGAHVIGRSSAAKIRCDDRGIEMHHAMLEVEGATIWFRQLSGRTAAVVDGTTVSGRVEVTAGQWIELGNSVLVVRDAPAPHPPATAAVVPVRPGDPWRRPFVRSPRAVVTASETMIEIPREAAAPGGLGGGLLPTVLGVAGAAALALLFHQLMFLLFGLMGALVAVGTWIAQRVGITRSRAGAGAATRRAVDEFVAALATQRAAVLGALLTNAPTLEAAVAASTNRLPWLWAVRPSDPDAFRVCIGLGEGFWQPPLAGIGNASAEVLVAVDAAAGLGMVPVTVALDDGAVVALVGDVDAAAVARSMMVQLATRSGPADWRLAVVTDRAALWEGLAWLGQLNDGTEPTRLVASADVDALVRSLDAGDDRHIVVVIDGPTVLHSRTDALRRMLAGQISTAYVVLCASEAEIPAAATSALVVNRNGTGRWIVDTRVAALADPVRIVGLSARRTAECSASIADLIDPEQHDDSSSIPTRVGLLGLLGLLDLGPGGIAENVATGWASAGTDPPLRCPLGVAADGVVDIDLVRDGPHALLAGTTGSGKSELLRTLVLGLAARSSPDHVSFVLIDYKGGATFDACTALPHVVGVVTDLDERLAARALRSLEAELRRREHILRFAGATDLTSYRASAATVAHPMPRLVVIVDEFATLAARLPEFMGALLGIAQRGRSLGVHLLLATQRPSGVVNDDIRANTNLRIALRVQDVADAHDVVGDAAASGLPRSVPGRAVMRLGADELIIFQTASCSGPMPPERGDLASGAPERSEIDVLVEAISAAARVSGCAEPHRPWVEPLPGEATLDDLPTNAAMTDHERKEVIAVVDDPDLQRRSSLTWPVGAGHLVIAGSTGSGTTTALLAVAAAVACGGKSGAATIYVIDALGDARLDALASVPSVAGVVRLRERERLLRVIDHLTRHISMQSSGRGSGSPGPAGDVTLLIDGLGALRCDLEASELWTQLDRLDAIIDDGLAAGVRVAMTVSRCGALPARQLGAVACRWVLHVADPIDAALFGLPAQLVPNDVPGRMVDVATRCEAQVIAPAPFTATCVTPAFGGLTTVAPAFGAPISTSGVIAELPTLVSIGELPPSVCAGADLVAPIAIGFESLRPVVLTVAAGEHVLVFGPSRSGRTSTLATIADRWHAARPGGWIGCIAPRRTSVRVGDLFASVPALLDALPDDRPVLVVVDDAELVDDPGGALAARISSRADDFTVVVAARPDALRASFGHWTAAVRRCRLGVILAGASDLDADLLGVVLPRRLPIPPRPGLAWLIADGERELVQLAMVEPYPTPTQCSFDVAVAVP